MIRSRPINLILPHHKIDRTTINPHSHLRRHIATRQTIRMLSLLSQDVGPHRRLHNSSRRHRQILKIIRPNLSINFLYPIRNMKLPFSKLLLTHPRHRSSNHLRQRAPLNSRPIRNLTMNNSRFTIRHRRLNLRPTKNSLHRMIIRSINTCNFSTIEIRRSNLSIPNLKNRRLPLLLHRFLLIHRHIRHLV